MDDETCVRSNAEMAAIVNAGIEMLTPREHVDAVSFMLKKGVPRTVVSRVIFQPDAIRSVNSRTKTNAVDKNSNNSNTAKPHI